jgi:hypothetical protein
VKIAVVGLGGVGGYFGGRIACEYAGSSGHQVVFVACSIDLAAIRSDSLLLKTVEGDFRVKPNLATDNLSEAGRRDLVLFSVRDSRFPLFLLVKGVLDDIVSDGVGDKVVDRFPLPSPFADVA